MWQQQNFIQMENIILIKEKFGEELVKFIVDGQTNILIYIEDPFHEDDWKSWNLLTKNIGKDCQIVGDDFMLHKLKIQKKE